RPDLRAHQPVPARRERRVSHPRAQSAGQAARHRGHQVDRGRAGGRPQAADTLRRPSAAPADRLLLDRRLDDPGELSHRLARLQRHGDRHRRQHRQVGAAAPGPLLADGDRGHRRIREAAGAIAGGCGQLRIGVMTIQSSRIHSAEYGLSSPRRRVPILRSVSIVRNLCHFACTRRMGPRLRGDDNWRVHGASFALALLACLIATDAFAAPLPSQLGPEVPITRPRDGYVGRLDVAPEHGPAGTEVTGSARELPPNAELQLIWRTVKGNWKVDGPEYHGRDFKPVGYEIVKLTSDHDGRLTASFVVPEDFGFAHDIVLQQGDRLLTQVNFSLDMTV